MDSTTHMDDDFEIVDRTVSGNDNATPPEAEEQYEQQCDEDESEEGTGADERVTKNEISSQHSIPPLQKKQQSRDLGVFSDLPESIKALVCYENPVHSAVVIGLIIFVAALSVVDLGITLPFLIVKLLELEFGLAAIMKLGMYLHDVTYLGRKVAKTPKEVMKPYVVRITSEGAPYGVPDISSTKKLISETHSSIDELVRCIFCESYVSTFKWIAILHVVGKIAQFFSFTGIILLACFVIFTVPVGYKKKKSEIDAVLDVGCKHWESIQTMASKFLPMGDKKKA